MSGVCLGRESFGMMSCVLWKRLGTSYSAGTGRALAQPSQLGAQGRGTIT